MADFHDFGADEADRLQLALERIARLKHRADVPARAVEMSAVAARLDTLIADLRAVLKKDGGD